MISLCSLLYLLAGQRDLSVEVTLNGLGKGLTSAQLLERPLSGNAVFHSQWKKGLSGQVLENDKNIGTFQVLPSRFPERRKIGLLYLLKLPAEIK